jgi:hypothetical protein
LAASPLTKLASEAQLLRAYEQEEEFEREALAAQIEAYEKEQLQYSGGQSY